MKEIVTINGKQFILESNIPLTQEQKNSVTRKLEQSNKTISLATTCASPIKRGTTKNIASTIDNAINLTPPYVYELYTYNSLYARYPPNGTTTLTSYTFPNVPFNTVGSVQVRLDVTDSCVGNPKGTTNCTVTVTDPALTSITLSGCATSISVGSTCTLSVACTDQFGTSMTCPTITWISRDPAIATVSNNGVVTGLSQGTARIYATSGGINSTDKSVTVSPPLCITPTCGFTITS